MRNQGIKAAGEVMTATLGTPAGHASPPPNVERLMRELECIIKRNPTEEYLRRLLNCAIAYEHSIR